MFITKKALPRRTFLRGVGATLALPMLDAMVPALAAKTGGPVPRLGFIYVSNGVIQNQWTPATTGAGFDLSPILKPLEPVRDHVNVLSGLSHLQADTFGDGTGDHPRASAVWLTGVHAYDRTKPGVEVRLATTADQLAARQIGQGLECLRSSCTWIFRRRGPAIRAIASTSIPSPGGTKRRRIPQNRIRASCSNDCSATAAAPPNERRVPGTPEACSIRSAKKFDTSSGRWDRATRES